MVWGSFKPHGHFSCKNITNAFLTLTVMVPSFMAVQYANRICSHRTNESEVLRQYESLLGDFSDNMMSIVSTQHEDSICRTYLGNPILTVNILFFLNVSVLFWIIGLVQHSFWLIDP